MASAAAFSENTGIVVQDSAITSIDSAICLVCAWLVPHLVSLHRLYHRTLKQSPQWIDKHVEVTEHARKVAGFGYAGGNPHIAAANTVVNWAIAQAILACAIFNIGTAITLALLTHDLDYRTSYILVGISLFVGACFIFTLSFRAPQWLGIYATLYHFQPRIELGTGPHSLARRVRMQTYKAFLSVFPFMAPFFCGAQPATIPFSIFAGLIMGFFLCLLMDWGNRTLKQPSHLIGFAIFVALSMILASAVLFSYGCSYVQNVWGNRRGKEVDHLAFALWTVTGVLLHAIVWKFSYDTLKAEHAQWHQSCDHLRPKTFFGPSVYFMPPPDLKSDPATRNDNEHDDLVGSNVISIQGDGNKEEWDSKDNGNKIRLTTIHTGSMDYEQQDQQINAINLETECDTHIELTEPEQTKPGLLPSEPEISFKDSPEPHPRTSKITFKEDVENNKDEEKIMQEVEKLERKCHVINEICCDLSCGQGGKTRSFMAKTFNFCSWLVWFLLFASSMFFILVMVGAQIQERTVRSYLPVVQEVIYSNMNTGPMCAFDDRDHGNNQTRRQKVEATQQTFSSPEECMLANYTILHCGACGKCSNWHDLRLEYATRNMLGEVALECSKKMLWGGGYDALLQCTMEETTFLEPCAHCWATDYECTKKHCLWIGLRAFMINTVTNLQVGADDITAATCEEAMCEATEVTGYQGFVPCSGASRRRMDVTSTIRRPEHQRCNQVGVVWEDFFGPSDGYLDYNSSYDNFI